MPIGSILLSLAIVMIFVILNGLFVAAEFAVIKLRPSRIEELVQRKVLGANLLQKLHRDTENTVAGAQLGITLASLFLGWLGEEAFTELMEAVLHVIPGMEALHVPSWVAIAFAFTIMSGLHIVIGEQVPKFMAIRFPESTLLKLGFPLYVFCMITKPFIWMLNGISNGIIRLMGMANKPEEGTAPTAEEFQILFDESAQAGQLERQETDILRRALELKAISCADAMLPRDKMDILEDNMSLDEVLAVVIAKKHTKFPVFRHGTNTVIGIVNTKDLFDIWTCEIARVDFSLTNLVRQAHFFRDSVAASSLLETMKALRIQMAIITDESGDTVGLLTLEDLVEQLVGEIWDEYDKPHGEIERISESSWNLTSRVTLYEFSTYFEASLDCESNCSTVAELMEELIDGEPEPGSEVIREGYSFKVVSAREGFISKIQVSKLVKA